MIYVISGTNRPGSKTRIVSGLITSFLKEAGAEVALLDLQELPLDLFHPDSYAEKPAAFSRFSDAVLASEGLLIVTPEYNGSFPGVLKVFIDHLKFPESFEHRPVGFVGLAAGPWGALRAVEQLQQIFSYRNAHLYPRKVLIPSVFKAVSDEGTLTDPDIERHLRASATGFVSFIKKFPATA
jgi:NAD(P)H-dependent FMN reductase